MAIKRLRKINLALLIATVIKFVNIIVMVVMGNVTQTVKCCEADSGYKSSNRTLKGSVYKLGYEEGYKAYTPKDYCHTCNSQNCDICDCNDVCSSCDSCNCVSHCEDCTDCSSNTTGGGAR